VSFLVLVLAWENADYLPVLSGFKRAGMTMPGYGVTNLLRSPSRRQWLIACGIFAAIIFLLFTTFLTNRRG